MSAAPIILSTPTTWSQHPFEAEMLLREASITKLNRLYPSVLDSMLRAGRSLGDLRALRAAYQSRHTELEDLLTMGLPR